MRSSDFEIETGESSTDASGGISVRVGSAQVGNGGNIALQAGDASTGPGGSIAVQSGAGTESGSVTISYPHFDIARSHDIQTNQISRATQPLSLCNTSRNSI